MKKSRMTTEIHEMFIKLHQLFNNNGNIFVTNI